MVVRQGSRLALIGLVLGVGAAIVGGRVTASLLYEVSPTDPLAMATAAALLFATAVAACAVPAWRASRVAPSEALRAD